MLIDGLDLIEGSINNNLVITNVTAAQKAVATQIDVGEIVFQTDGVSGLYIYHGASLGWKLISTAVDVNDATNLTTGTLAAARLPTSGVSAGTYKSVTVDETGRVTAATNPSTLTVYGITDAVDIANNQTITGTKTFSALETTGAIKKIGGTAPAYYMSQDGSGRQHWYWNTIGGTAPVYSVSSEGATDIMHHADNAGNEYMQFRAADGATKNAGDSIAWESVLYVSRNGTFTYKGSNVITSANAATTLAASATTDTTNATNITTGTLAAARLPASGVSAGTYKSVTVDTTGRVTAATNPTTLAGYGITDSVALTTSIPTFAGGASGYEGGEIHLKAAPSSTTLIYDTHIDVNDNHLRFFEGGGSTRGAYVDLTACTPSSGTNLLTPSWNNITSKPTTLSGFGITDAVNTSALGANSGVATLDSSGKVLTAQLPSYVDDVLEYTNQAALPASGETGKIYVALDTNKIYRWTGSVYIEISPTAGNSDTSTRLATARSIAMTGDVSWAIASFDGSANVTAAGTLATTGVSAGSYQSVTVDTKGRVTAGTNPTTLSGFGITDAVSTTGSLATCTVDGVESVGFRNVPQNSQSAAYTCVLADSGKHIFHPAADSTARTYTIPANSSVAYPIGTAISFVNMSTAAVTIAITTDAMYLAGTGTTGSRTLAQYGTATALKIASSTWLISGAGLT
jgi:phage-related tail fiber protein